MLTESQVAQFHRDGFIKGNRVLTDEQIKSLQEETLRVIADREDKSKPQPVMVHNMKKDASAPVWQIVNIHLASKPFMELVSHPTIAEEIAQLTNAKEVRLWHDQIQFKPAETGGVNMWHQDSPYWPTLQPKTTQVTAWIALDDVDVDNGCMSMVPGSQNFGDTVSYLHTLKDFRAMPTEFNGKPIEVKTCPVKRGEVHYHHALTWHGSHENKSGRPRRAIALHFMNEQTTYDSNGKHVMKEYIKVPHGSKMEGDAFPQTWPRK
jgi:ectoine hydroxylase-related dioxygenase (phytanoyl-CoA dioxygenase family)